MPSVQVPAQPTWPVGATSLPPLCVPCSHIMPAAQRTRLPDLLGWLQTSAGKAESASKQELKVGEVSRRPELVDDFIRNFLVRMSLSKTLELFETEWCARQPRCSHVCVCLGQVTASFLRQLSTQMQHKDISSMSAVCSLGAPSALCLAVQFSVACLLLCVLRGAAPQHGALGSLTCCAKHQLVLVCRYELKATGRWSGPPEKVPDLYAANLALEEQLQDVRKELLDAKTVAGKVCVLRARVLVPLPSTVMCLLEGLCPQGFISLLVACTRLL